MLTSWTSWHVHQHQGQDRLLTEAVAPLIGIVRSEGLADLAFVLRYWDGGPHVRLRLRAPSDAALAVLERRVPAELRSWCRDHPSGRSMSAGEYALLRGRIGGSDAAAELVPDGSVVPAVYSPEHERYGRGAALEACEEHFDESTRIALDVLAADPPAAARDSLVVLILAGFFAARGLTAGADWARRVQAAGLPAAARLDLRRVVSLMERPPAAAHRFARSLERLETALRVAADDYRSPAVGFGGVTFATTGADDPITTLDICIHLFANRIGVTLPTELMLRAALAQALLTETKADA
ncbi:lantibiotic dehydratase C-terminal domain-containing protein [Kitasatospora herbaricolor]|uniref:Thiopeptide-type bacteriocin biosynthesis domain-containing protein n=1 Tax=Kitasatospora herbaricolor TaxID=68217 RepID=A0ABZ1WAV6_9ACTN|nr:lantibiotic dehydratase C-terminal domain-containing protein [Kitasatospora herbaricolor]